MISAFALKDQRKRARVDLNLSLYARARRARRRRIEPPVGRGADSICQFPVRGGGAGDGAVMAAIGRRRATGSTAKPPARNSRDPGAWSSLAPRPALNDQRLRIERSAQKGPRRPESLTIRAREARAPPAHRAAGWPPSPIPFCQFPVRGGGAGDGAVMAAIGRRRATGSTAKPPARNSRDPGAWSSLAPRPALNDQRLRIERSAQKGPRRPESLTIRAREARAPPAHRAAGWPPSPIPICQFPVRGGGAGDGAAMAAIGRRRATGSTAKPPARNSRDPGAWSSLAPRPALNDQRLRIERSAQKGPRRPESLTIRAREARAPPAHRAAGWPPAPIPICQFPVRGGGAGDGAAMAAIGRRRATGSTAKPPARNSRDPGAWSSLAPRPALNDQRLRIERSAQKGPRRPESLTIRAREARAPPAHRAAGWPPAPIPICQFPVRGGGAGDGAAMAAIGRRRATGSTAKPPARNSRDPGAWSSLAPRPALNDQRLRIERSAQKGPRRPEFLTIRAREARAPPAHRAAGWPPAPIPICQFPVRGGGAGDGAAMAAIGRRRATGSTAKPPARNSRDPGAWSSLAPRPALNDQRLRIERSAQKGPRRPESLTIRAREARAPPAHRAAGWPRRRFLFVNFRFGAAALVTARRWQRSGGGELPGRQQNRPLATAGTLGLGPRSRHAPH